MTLLSPVVAAIDTHTAGEPARIVLNGLPTIPGETMAAKKDYFCTHLDHWRCLLMQEPRGHQDMFGVILTTATSADANYGALFIHSGGMLDMCGHGLMALTTVLLETGWVQACAPETVLRFNTAAGLVETRARIEAGQVSGVSVINVPSYVLAHDLRISVPHIGEVLVDLVYAGNVFALVSGTALGVTVATQNLRQLIHLGMDVRAACNVALSKADPNGSPIDPVELTKIYEHPDPATSDTRSVVIFGTGQLDRSPCGTGTSAAMALAHARGTLALGVEHISENLLGSCFRGHLQGQVTIEDRQAVVPLVCGETYITGQQQFLLDPRDPLAYGFVLDVGV